MAASVNLDSGDVLQVLYLIDNDEIANSEGDMGNCNYDNYTFKIV